MDETKRTKILAGALAGILGFMFVKPHEVFMKPITEARRSLVTAESSLETAKDKDFELLNAQERISRASDTSLPPQTADAQRVYKRWIKNLAEQCRFAAPRVAPGNTEYRRGKFLTVDVTVEAETNLEGLSRFLYLFEQADLLHRVSALEIESTGVTGTPRMEVTLTAQGMSILGSPDHSDVFPLTSLATPVDETTTEVTIADAKGFPKEGPFLAQLGKEMIQVTAVGADNTWTVERGQKGTKPAAHPENEYVQLFPVAYQQRDVSFDDYESFVSSSPFTKPTKPRALNPRLASISEKTIEPGESITLTAKAEDVDSDVGAIAYALENAVEDMTINAETGEIQWTAAPDLEPKKYEATVVVTQKNNEDLRLEKAFAVNVQLPNDAPTVTVPEKAVVVIGREFELQLAADDDGPTDKLTYSLDGEVPEGLSVEGTTGKLQWTPARTFSPGDYSVTVKVTDGGEPAKSASESLALSVQDDTAVLTRFTGSVTLDGESLAFFRNMADNTKPQLKIGGRIQAADIDAEVKQVGERHVLLADSAGVWKLNLGDNLRQRELIEPAAEPAAVETSAEETAPVDSPAEESENAEQQTDEQ